MSLKQRSHNLNKPSSLQYALMNIVHVSEYKIQKEVLEGAKVPRRPEITPTSLCCLKPLFNKTCRMRAITVAIRKKQEGPKGYTR